MPKTPVFVVPKYANPLDIKVQFFYEADNGKIQPLTDQSVLKSGQHVGVAFQPESDCYVYIFWWDSTGGVGQLFPNPQLTEGTGKVKAGQTYWLPSRDGERWYVLDENPGVETIYFVATRTRNEKLENLLKDSTSPASDYQEKIQGKKRQPGTSAPAVATEKPPEARKKAETEVARELSLMGFASYTAPKSQQKVSFDTKERLFKEMENRIKISGAEAVFKVQFRHDPR